MGKLYHKLVRDRIPEIIAANGQTCVTEVLEGDTYREMLGEKLSEECAEVRGALSDAEVLEELADVLEVVYAMAADRGCSVDALEKIRRKKAEERGGFDARILLREVEG